MGHVIQVLIVSISYFVFIYVAGENIGLRKHAGKRLQVTYKSVMSVSVIHCNALCRREASCRASNHNAGTGECQFSEVCHSDIEGNVVTDSSWDVYALNGKYALYC